jgi:hypothetical protein
MSSTHSTLSEIYKSAVPAIAMQNLHTGDVEKWWAWPSAKIDSTRFTPTMKELPVYKEEGTYFDPRHVLSHYAFRLDPDDEKKMLVVPLNAFVTKKKIFNYPLYEYTRPFQVSIGTPIEVVKKLYQHYAHRNCKTEERIRIDYGDVNTLKSWNETYDVEGYVGATTGDRKAFILVHNKRSMGGGCILTDCILSIRTARKETGTDKYHYFYTLNEPFTNPLKKVSA